MKLTGVASGLLLLLASTSAALLLSSCGTCQVPIRQTALPPVSGQTGSFDAIEIDNSAHRLYIADRTDGGVDVFDISTSTAKYVSTIVTGGYPNGLALASFISRLYVGLADGNVVAIDTEPTSKTFYTVVARVAVGAPSADLIDYGAKRNRIYVGTGAAGFVASIDPTDNSIAARWVLNATVEQPRYNPADGKVYVTSPTADALFQIDPEDGKLTRTYKLRGCMPTGMAINPGRHLALIACAGTVVTVDLVSGLVQFISGVPGGDIVTYDPVADLFLVASAPPAKKSYIGVYSGSGDHLNSVHTDAAGHAAAYDATNKLVYTPDARKGQAQLLSFNPMACQPPPEWLNFLLGLGAWVAPLAVLAVVAVIYARRRDRARALAAAKRR